MFSYYNSTIFAAIVFLLQAIFENTEDLGSAAMANATNASQEVNGILCFAIVNASLYGASLSQYCSVHIHALLTVRFCSPIFHSVLAVV